LVEITVENNIHPKFTPIVTVITSLIFKLAKYCQKVEKKKMEENEMYFKRFP
jgi:hypothetical protein